MSVLSEVTKIYDMNPVKTSTPVPVGSALKQHRDDNNQSVISHRSAGKGDFSCVEAMDASGGINVPPNPPPPTAASVGSFKGTPNRPMPSSLQRIKSQIVELFSRGNPSRSGSIRKMSKSNRTTELQTIFSSGSSSSGVPQLVGATRTSSTPMLPAVATKSDPHNNHGKVHSSGNANKVSRTQLDSSCQNGYRRVSTNHINSSIEVNPSTSFRMCGKDAVQEGEDSKILPADGETVEEVNMKLCQENRQLWEDNRTLAAALEDAQVKLEHLQRRNKYLEVAMYQEGHVLADIIKECHEEIEKLKQTQCELLLGDDNQALYDKKIREYYIEKYAGSNNEVVKKERE